MIISRATLSLLVSVSGTFVSAQEVVGRECRDLKFVQDNREDFILSEYIATGRIKVMAAGAAGLAGTGAVELGVLAWLRNLKADVPVLESQLNTLRNEIAEFNKLLETQKWDLEQITRLEDRHKQVSSQIKVLESRQSHVFKQLHDIEKHLKNLPQAEYRELVEHARKAGTAVDRYRMEAEIKTLQQRMSTATETRAELDRRLKRHHKALGVVITQRAQIAERWLPTVPGNAAVEQTALQSATRKSAALARVTSAINKGTVALKGALAGTGVGLVALTPDLGPAAYDFLVASGAIEPWRFRAAQDFENYPGLLANADSGYTFAERCAFLRKSPKIQEAFVQAALKVTQIQASRAAGNFVLETQAPPPVRLFVRPGLTPGGLVKGTSQ